MVRRGSSSSLATTLSLTAASDFACGTAIAEGHVAGEILDSGSQPRRLRITPRSLAGLQQTELGFATKNDGETATTVSLPS
jgi:hypothetical protein